VAWDLKSSVHPLTSFYQMILRSIYRRFSRQSKLTSYRYHKVRPSSFPHLFEAIQVLISNKLDAEGRHCSSSQRVFNPFESDSILTLGKPMLAAERRE